MSDKLGCTFINGTSTNFYLGALFHVFILFVILTVFFILVISKTEKKIISAEFQKNIKNMIQKQFPQLNKKTKGKLCHTLGQVMPALKTLSKYYSTPNQLTESHNNWLKFTSILICGVIGFMFIILYIVLRFSCGFCGTFFELVVENAFIFVGVGLIEYMFFIHIASKYIPTKPDELVKNIIGNLTKSLNKLD